MYLGHIGNNCGIKHLDASKFPDVFLRKGEDHYKTYIFDALPYVPDINPSEDQKQKKDEKHQYLTRLEYIDRVVVEQGCVRTKRSCCPNCHRQVDTPTQKMVDVKLSVRLVELALSKTVDKIVLIAGDRDFLPAVEAIEKSGTIVRLVYSQTDKTGTNSNLIRCCPEKYEITKADLLRCELKDIGNTQIKILVAKP